MNKAVVLKLALKYVRVLKRNYELYYSGQLDGYCPHGVYVGGCGIDWMCPVCEDGIGIYEHALNNAYNDARRMMDGFKLKVQMAALNSFVEHSREPGIEFLSSDDRAEMIKRLSVATKVI